MDPQPVGLGFTQLEQRPQPIPALCFYTLTHTLPAEALALSALDHRQTQQLLLAQTAKSPTPLKKQGEKMEAFNEPLSAKTSLPTATKRLCENKSTEVTASPGNSFHPSWLFSVQICRGCFALPPPFSADTGLICKTLQLNQTLLLKERCSKEYS